MQLPNRNTDKLPIQISTSQPPSSSAVERSIRRRRHPSGHDVSFWLGQSGVKTSQVLQRAWKRFEFKTTTLPLPNRFEDPWSQSMIWHKSTCWRHQFMDWLSKTTCKREIERERMFFIHRGQLARYCSHQYVLMCSSSLGISLYCPWPSFPQCPEIKTRCASVSSTCSTAGVSLSTSKRQNEKRNLNLCTMAFACTSMTISAPMLIRLCKVQAWQTRPLPSKTLLQVSSGFKDLTATWRCRRAQGGQVPSASVCDSIWLLSLL